MKAGVIGLLACVVTSSLLGGCVIDHRSEAPPDGTLTVDWTIADARDPGDCANYNASALELSVSPVGGGTIETFDASCADFLTRVSLPPGDYSATATLIDPSGRSKTTSIPIHGFTIEPNTDLDIPIDFPTSSFF